MDRRAEGRIGAGEFIAKPMRHAPLTAAFGILVIFIYAALSIGAPIFAILLRRTQAKGWQND